MQPRPITDRDLAYWRDLQPRAATFTGPGEIEANIQPAPGIITQSDAPGLDVEVCRVPFTIDEIDMAHLAHGGTIWVSFFGGCPIHQVEVQPRDAERRE
jgi:hypothetical protein